MTAHNSLPNAVVIGGGPAGLMAAEQLAQDGVAVTVYDGMRSVGRKFLLAGRGGLNITHSEPFEQFVGRYGRSQPHLQPFLTNFGPNELRAWVHDLGIATFVGTSGRVFPAEMKAAPLLRAWLKRLRASGVQFQMQHRWLGWDECWILDYSAGYITDWGAHYYDIAQWGAGMDDTGPVRISGAASSPTKASYSTLP